ncbi:hypothetical protein GYMLUDRAFT_165265, partial [Collybiopsis luxurians FD-317 M1]
TLNLSLNFSIDDRPTVATMVNGLLHYLPPHCAMYYFRTVCLIWESDSEAATMRRSHMASILAPAISSSESRNVHELCETIGSLWGGDG